MRKLIITLLLPALLFIATSCEQEEVPIPIDIDYQINGSSAPLYITFKTNKDLRFSNWYLNENHLYGFMNEDSVRICLQTPGENTLRLEAMGEDSKKYIGEIEFDVPNFTSELVIKGLYMEDKARLGFDRDSVVLRFYQYNKKDNPFYRMTYATSTLIEPDVLMFPEPISFEVFNSNDYDNRENSDIFFTMESTPSMTTIHKAYFSTAFDVISKHREGIYGHPYKIYLDKSPYFESEMSLVVDWR
jgi:hypothetical protein